MIHGHRRFVSGVYFKIHPICCNSLHCNHRFLPIAPGFTILECLHRCLGTESPLAAAPPTMLVRYPGVVIIIMGLLIPPPLSCSGVPYPPPAAV